MTRKQLRKLEALHAPHSKYWDCYNDEPLKENHALESAKITADVAIRFAEWYQSRFNAKSDYGKSTNDMFEDFIKSNLK